MSLYSNYTDVGAKRFYDVDGNSSSNSNNSNSNTCQDSIKEGLLRESSASALQSGEYAERLTGNNNDLYIRSFLINTTQNSRLWSVSPNTIRDNVLSIVGRPLILDQNPLTGKADHTPWLTSLSASQNMARQNEKAIGVVEKVFYDKETDSYYADSRITDPKAKEYINRFHSSRIPIHVSPQLLFDSRKEPNNGPYKNWQFTHLAIVHKGAYDNAHVIGTCVGGTECHSKLQHASPSSSPAATAVASASSAPISIPPNGKRRGVIA